MYRAGGIAPVWHPTLLLIGAQPWGALPSCFPRVGAPLLPAVPGAGPPTLRKWAGFPQVDLALTVCLVLTIYKISIYLLPRSHGFPLPNTMPPMLYILPDLFCLQNALYSQFFNFLYHPSPCPLKA